MEKPDSPLGEDFAHRFEKGKGPENIRPDESIRGFNRSIHMGFSGEIDNGIHPFADQLFHKRSFGNIASDEIVRARITQV
jgi:hypothetical protein